MAFVFMVRVELIIIIYRPHTCRHLEHDANAPREVPVHHYRPLTECEGVLVS